MPSQQTRRRNPPKQAEWSRRKSLPPPSSFPVAGPPSHGYGFYPLRLPEDLDFAALFHGDDERIPVAGFHWGMEVLAGMLRNFLTES